MISATKNDLVGSEFQRGGVDAIAQASGFWAVFKHVTEMGVTPSAEHFGTAREEAVIRFRFHVGFSDGSVKARPTGAGFKFGLGAEQRHTTTNALVDTGFVIVPILPREGPFGSFFSRNSKLFRCELFLPFGVGFDNFVVLVGHGGS
jgi:hypothetical protein